MIKFHSLVDKKLFLRELGEYDLASSIVEDYQPTDEMYNSFIAKRRKDRGLKDHRKSQMGKAQWRGSRHNIMRGIKAYHKSTEGKRFHRNLADYVLRGKNDKLSSLLTYEALVSLNSAKTHLILEANYYHSQLEQSSLEYFIECVINEFPKIEYKIYKNEAFNDYEESFVLSLVETNEVIKSLANTSGRSFAEVETMWKSLKQALIDKGHDESDDDFYAILVTAIKKGLDI